ncbi:MAG: type II toxin-antitoxin system HicB family antitoxin [Nitrospirae bacterium]|nr:type II toxin-antitoxin system HicB family antitoxin [Nitrospirota bacterium]
MNLMEYKNYVALIEYDPDIDMFHGRVINATPNTFYGKSVDDLKKEFKTTIEDYLEFCREKGLEPSRPYSGKFNLRISPELHRNIAIEAAKSGKSLNSWITEHLEQSIQHLVEH